MDSILLIGRFLFVVENFNFQRFLNGSLWTILAIGAAIVDPWRRDIPAGVANPEDFNNPINLVDGDVLDF